MRDKSAESLKSFDLNQWRHWERKMNSSLKSVSHIAMMCPVFPSSISCDLRSEIFSHAILINVLIMPRIIFIEYIQSGIICHVHFISFWCREAWPRYQWDSYYNLQSFFSLFLYIEVDRFFLSGEHFCYPHLSNYLQLVILWFIFIM